MAAPISTKGFIIGTSKQRLAGAGSNPYGGVVPDAFGIWWESDTDNLYQSTNEGWRLVASLGGNKAVVTTNATNYAVLSTDNTIIESGSSKTITLPSAVVAGAGKRYTLKNGNVTGTTVAATAGNIDGAATDTTSLATAYQHAQYVSDGTNWFTC
jgi:hypothetical protein